jgi:hypothetical protein
MINNDDNDHSIDADSATTIRKQSDLIMWNV